MITYITDEEYRAQVLQSSRGVIPVNAELLKSDIVKKMIRVRICEALGIPLSAVEEDEQ